MSAGADTEDHSASARPTYRDLPEGDAAGVYGAEDVLGALNLISSRAIVDASRLVVSGEVFALSHPISWLEPPLYSRGLVRHNVFRTKKGNLDDWLDGYYPQASSQWDGFMHVADPVSGHYNHRPPSDLGIDSWANRGIVGRGVLLDVARWAAKAGHELDWTHATPISVDDLDQCRRAQDVTRAVGDVLLVRTGWEAGYREASAAHRASMAGASGPWPGLEASAQMAEYLWEWGVGAVAADNPSLEVSPNTGDRLHTLVLARLGIPIGELWRLDGLADACDRDERYDFLLTSAPLHVVGGVGSPANALAVR